MEKIPKIPDDYISTQYIKKSRISSTTPRRWTDKEVEWVLDWREKGYSIQEIADSVSRTPTSVHIKIKRISKTTGEYNAPHIKDKYKYNKKFIEEIQPRHILDVYCGENSFYKNEFPEIAVTTNDKDKNIEADYHMDATKFCALMYAKGNKYDIVDLDPFGSAYAQFGLAIMMARKGLVITLGEMGHKRWKRVDYVRRVYGINNLEEFTVDNIIKEIISLAEKYKVKLEVHTVRNYRQISRVYFTVGKLSSEIDVKKIKEEG